MKWDIVVLKTESVRVGLDEMRHSCFENRIGESWLDEMRLFFLERK